MNQKISENIYSSGYRAAGRIRRRLGLAADRVQTIFRWVKSYVHRLGIRRTGKDIDPDDGMWSLSEMTLFEKATLGFLGVSVLALMAFAASSPIDRTAYAPQAKFLPPEAVPQVEVAGELILRSIQRNRAGLTVRSLRKTFSTVKYDFDSVQAGEEDVPPVFLMSMPSDIGHIRVPEQRKEIFFQSVLPLILKVNQEILDKRRRVAALAAQVRRGAKLPAEERLWLAAISEQYKTRRNDFAALLRRIDVVPPSLALAQAAEESGWGTSRFVREGNALFGQWTVEEDEDGLLPSRRDRGKTHRVKAFDSLLDGVRAYARNLNSHRAYRAMRSHRADMRKAGSALNGLALSSSLSSYSARGEEYVRSLQVIIRTNRLHKLDGARLGDKVVSLPAEFQAKPSI